MGEITLHANIFMNFLKENVIKIKLKSGNKPNDLSNQTWHCLIALIWPLSADQLGHFDRPKQTQENLRNKILKLILTVI